MKELCASRPGRVPRRHRKDRHRAGEGASPVAPGGPAGHTAGMDQEHEDYADSGEPRRGSPLVVLTLIGVTAILAALAFLPILPGCLHRMGR